MTPRSFWIILIRILGIWFVLDSLQIIYSYLTYIPLLSDATAISAILTALIITTLVIIFFFLILYLCLFRTDWIIDKLKLDKGFSEEKFELNMHRSSIYAISIIVIGGIILLRSFPQLCRQLILYFQQSSLPTNYSSNPTWSYILLNFIQTVIGVYFITSNRTIVNFIEKQRRKSRLNKIE
jgi:hypothetical protein